jgi:hypothetical protein
MYTQGEVEREKHQQAMAAAEQRTVKLTERVCAFYNCVSEITPVSVTLHLCQ